ncbi:MULTISPECIES: hypothetical protein [Clostridium]|uniref:Transposase n=1 Tax=Clostridium carnis TaxID=1530 RepID=A0ABY6ST62_9CLOT|nr:hypothetical protein [Clostridium carnis]CAI3661425.1 conserved hypothetical protein [Clostridium neonatale]CAI3662011.1 conserved hypothetical protein [Clostridium neonatale]CAI3682226.1 conserved hypothetical protein [Clostridium neonatale]CAI3693749.1 conserved hypothetical protein [Clostridium neonatale]CAI3706243.1 conserved hypothetical protein [Clostridium neonatale]
MTKEDQAFKYFTDNTEKSKEKLIKEVVKKFRIAESSANIYYYRWKSEFMDTDNCIPKEEKKIEKPKPKGKQEIKVPHDTKPIDVSKEEVFKKSKLKIKEGLVEYAGKEYKVKDGTLKVGEESFRNIDDLEEYKKRQLKEFYSWIGEIADVLEMIN